MEKKKIELESIIMSASKEKLEKIHFIINFVADATPEEMIELHNNMADESFNVSKWIESKKNEAMSNEKTGWHFAVRLEELRIEK